MVTSPQSANIPPHDPRRKWIAGTVLLATTCMLVLSFAAVPLYRLFCARTGFAGTTQVAEVAPAAKGTRTLVVHFDANVAPALDWSFAPETSQISLQTGKVATVFFKVTNRADHEIAARAMYNVSPGQTGAYFDKIACFCFKEQHLAAHETMEMPVVFFLDPALEKDETMNGIEEVTLSYTFFPALDQAPVTAAQDTGEEGSRL